MALPNGPKLIRTRNTRGRTSDFNPVRGDLFIAAHVLRDNPNPVGSDLRTRACPTINVPVLTDLRLALLGRS